MDEAHYRKWTLGLLGVAAFFAAGLFALGLVPYTHGLPVPSVLVVVTIGTTIFAGILGFYTFPLRRFAAYLAARRAEKSSPVPTDLGRELIALVATAKRVWGPDANYLESLSICSRNVLNALNQQLGKATGLTPVFVQEANGLVSGWRTQRPVHLALITQMEAMAEFGADMDVNVALVLVTSLASLVVSGVNVTNAFSQAVSNSGVELAKYQREEWTQFANKANRLSEDVMKLAEKFKPFTGDMKVYILQVRGL